MPKKLHGLGILLVAFLLTLAAGSFAPPSRPASADLVSPYAPGALTPIITTRGQFDLLTGILEPESDPNSYFFQGAIPGFTGGHCTGDVVVYVHGFQNDEATAMSNFNIAKRSLEANGYWQPLIGFSWDSNPGAAFFAVAATIATSNGQKLGQFLLDFKEECPDTNVRLISHSLGARVILNALSYLDSSDLWDENGHRITSVHLLGAAVGNGEISTALPGGFGKQIEKVTCELHNKYDPEDDVLTFIFPPGGIDLALGQTGAEAGIPLPVNFHEENVLEEIISVDSDGNGSPDTAIGDNHSGYAGVLVNGELVDDGAIDRVVDDWRRQAENLGCFLNLSQSSGSSGFSEMAASGDDLYVVWEDNTPGNFDVFLRASHDSGATFAPSINLSSNSGNSRFPRVATFGENVYVVWQDYTSGQGHIYFRSSADSGETFGGVQILSNDPAVTQAPHSNARVAAGADGAYVVWNSQSFLTSGAPSQAGEVYARFIPVSGQPGPVVNISQSAGRASAFPWVAVSDEIVAVSYQEGGLFGDLGANGQIYLVTAAPGGSFGSPVAVTGEESNSTSSRAAVLGSDIYIAWNGATDGSFDPWFRKVVGGTDFEPSVNVGNTPGDSFDMELALADGRIYVLWSDNSFGGHEILFSRSADDGASFSQFKNLSEAEGSSQLPDLAADGSNVLVVWAENLGGESYETYARVSRNHGRDFGLPVNLSDNEGDTWVLSAGASNETLYAAWMDFTPGAAEVFFRSGRAAEAVPFEGSVILSTPDRGDLPLRRAMVTLETDAGHVTTFTDDQGNYRLALPDGATTGRLRLTLTDRDGFLAVHHPELGPQDPANDFQRPVLSNGVPAFVVSSVIEFDIEDRGDLLLMSEFPWFFMNGISFDPSADHLPFSSDDHCPCRIAGLAGIYYYSLTALDFARTQLPGLRLDADLPLEVIGFYPDGGFFNVDPEPFVTLSEGNEIGSSLADDLNTTYEIDTIFHEVAHYIQFESVIGGENTLWRRDLRAHPALERQGAPHQGYGLLDSSDSWGEGLADFLTPVIRKVMLTDEAHRNLFFDEPDVTYLAGGFDLEYDYPAPGFRVQFDTPDLAAIPFMYVGLNEELSIASLLWDLHDSTVTEDPAHLALESIWRILTTPIADPNSPGNRRFVETISDVYLVLEHSPLVDTITLNQLFGRRYICVDSNGNHECEGNTESHGHTAWLVLDPEFGIFRYPYPPSEFPDDDPDGYPYGLVARPAPPIVEQNALLVEVTDDAGLPIEGAQMTVFISTPDGLAFDYTRDLSAASTVVGFHMPHPGTARMVFSKDGYGPAEVTVSSDDYIAGVMDPDQYALTVQPALTRANTPPVASPLAGTVNEDTSVDVVITGGDVEGDPLSFTIVTPPANGILGPITSLSPTSAQVRFTPAPDFNGTDIFQFIASDGRDDSAPATVSLTFQSVNDRPIADAGMDHAAQPGNVVTLDGSASNDADGDALTFEWMQIAGPPVVLSDSAAPQPTFTAPDVTAQTALAFQLVVNDLVTSSLPDAVSVVVSAPTGGNLPPVADAGEDVAVQNSALVTLDGSGSFDPEGGNLTYSWTQISGPVVTLDGGDTASPAFTAPDVLTYSTLGFELTVSDGADSSAPDAVFVTVQPSIIILPPSSGPTADAGPDLVVDEGDMVMLDGAGSQGAMTYSWAGSVALSDFTSATPSFTAPMVTEDSVLTFRLIVTSSGVNPDSCMPLTGGGLFAIRIDCSKDAVNVLVRDVNDPPMANAGPDQVVSPSELVTLDGSGSFDPDDDPLLFTWQQVAGPAVTLSSLAADSPTFTAPEVTSDTVLTFQMRVTDGIVDSNLTAVNVVVAAGGAPAPDTEFDNIVEVGRGDISLMAVEGDNVYIVANPLTFTTVTNREIFLYRSTDQGQTFTSTNLSNMPGASRVHDIAVSGSSVYIVWHEQVSGTAEIYVTVSHDSGATFTTPVPLDSSSSLPTDPRVIASGTNAYVVWSDSGGIRFQRSSDGGTTWQTPVDITGSLPGDFSAANPQIALSGNDVYVTWRHSELTLDPGGFFIQQPSEVMFRASHDGGASFDPAVNLSNSAGFSSLGFRPGSQLLAIGSTVYVVWHDDTSGDTDVFLSRSLDSGNTFEPPVNLSNSPAGSNRVSIVGAGNDIYVAWTEGPSPVQLFLRRSDDGGVTFSPAANLNSPGETSTGTPHLAVDGKNVHVIFYEAVFDPCCDNLINYRVSSDRGVTFSAPLDVNGGSGTCCPGGGQVAISNGIVYLMWEDPEMDTIFFRGPVPVADRTPVADAGPDQSVDEGVLVALDGSGSFDPEGAPLAYTWSQVAGPPVTLTNASAVAPSFTAPVVDEDTLFIFQLIVNDGVQDSLPDAVSVVVRNVPPPPDNFPPVAEAGEDQFVPGGSLVSLSGTSSSDPDGDSLFYAWTQIGGPDVTLDGADTATPSFVADALDADAVLTFQLVVSDGELLSSPDAVNVMLEEPENLPPVADTGADQTAFTGDLIALDGLSSFDPEGKPLVYAWTQIAGPAVTLTGTDTAQPSFTAPAITSDAVLAFQLVVNDGALDSIPDAVAVIIIVPVAPPDGVPPVADAGPDQAVSPDDTVALDGFGSFDPDGGPLSYAWTQVSGPAVTLTGSDTVAPSFTTSADVVANTVLAFQLVVNDGEFNSALDVVFITVVTAPVNTPPVAGAGPDQSVFENAPVSLDGTDSSDPDGDALIYLWAQIGGPAIDLTNATFANPTFTAPEVDGPVALTFELIVTDSAGATDTDTVAVSIADLPVPPVNFAPVADAGVDQSAVEGATTLLDGTGSFDSDGDVLTYTWAQVSGPVADIIDPLSVRPSVVLPSGSDGQHLVFQLVVSDGSVDSEPDQVTVSVIAVAPPPDAPPQGQSHESEASSLSGVVGFDTYLDEYVSDSSPVFDVPPTPAAGSVIEVTAGETVTFAAQCSDLDLADTLSLWLVNAPAGATLVPGIAGNPASAGFAWASSGIGAMDVTLACADDHGATVEHTLTIDVQPALADGRMTGGGSIRSGGERVTHGFTLRCSVDDEPQSLQINWGRNRFHLENVNEIFCVDDPAIDPNPRNSDFDTMRGLGTGRLNGKSGATVEWLFTDGGEPGKKDQADMTVRNSAGDIVLQIKGSLQNGNHQAH